MPQQAMTVIYEQLWREAAAALQRGEPQLDAHLPGKANDLRRGLTLLLRPSASVRDRVAECISQLSALCPDQYFYRPEELHVTVMSIVSGTEHWREAMHPLGEYQAVLAQVLARQRPFRLTFRGLTATPGVVMVQGFPEDDALNDLRDRLRTAFATAGFSGVLDRRYKISTAHMTVMRFCRPEADWSRLLAVLEVGRSLDFGSMTADGLELVLGDWYASAGTVQRLSEYRLISA